LSSCTSVEIPFRWACHLYPFQFAICLVNLQAVSFGMQRLLTVCLIFYVVKTIYFFLNWKSVISS
jgi:hypothetical protein